MAIKLAALLIGGSLSIGLVSSAAGQAQAPAPPAYYPTNPQPNVAAEPPSVTVNPITA